MNYKKNIVIVGATGVLSSGIVNLIKDECKNLIILDINSNKLKKISDHHKITSYVLDVTKEKQIKIIFSKIINKFKKIDVLINCASLTSEFAGENINFFDSFENYDYKLWKKSIDVSLNGVFLTCREVIKHMKQNKQGSIINISSIYGVVGPTIELYENEKFNNLASYTSSKFAIIGLTKWLAMNYANDGIRVNTVSPGGIESGQSTSFTKKYNAITPMRRMGKPEDIIGIIKYLISDESSYTTGQNFIVDGGYTVK